MTRFDLELHPVPTDILSGQIMYPAEDAGDLLRFYRDLFLEAPDEVICYPFLLRVPALDAVPAAWHGKLALDFVVAYVGHPDDGVGHLAVFRELGDPIFEHVAPQPYPQLQRSFDATMGKGNRWYSRAQQFDAFTDEAIDALVEHLEPFPGEFTSVYLAPGGGASARVPPGATAFPHRSSAHELHVFPGWTDPAEDEAVMAWADALHEALLPHGNGAVYVNLLGDGEEARIPDAYRDNYERLRKAKARWDPDNLFRGNHNIPPAE